MTFTEKLLYHQIHPTKLAVDVATALAASYFLWVGNLDAFWIVFLAPSVVVTALVIQFADLERLKDSEFGKYVGRYMNVWAMGFRIAGQVLMWLGAYTQDPVSMGLGVLIIAGAWAYALPQAYPAKKGGGKKK